MANNTKNIMIVGVGGQGTLLTSRIAGCPVVDIRQEFINRFYAFAVIVNAFNKKCVKIIFFIVFVRQSFQKRFRLGSALQFLCEAAKVGDSYADNQIGADIRH